MTDPCPKIAARMNLDDKRGCTTSEAVKDFIRRTCPCDACNDWRREQRVLVKERA